MSSATRRVGLRGRLLALVLVPTLVAAILAGSAAAEKRRAAEVASAVHVEVRGLLELVDVRTAMMSARIPVEVEVRSEALGLDPAAVLSLLDLDGQRFDDLAEVQAKIRSMPERIQPFEPEELDRLRQEIRRGASPEVIDRFTQLEELTDETWADELAVVQRQTETLGHSELGDLLRELDRSARATSAMASTVTGLADYWFADMAGAQRVDTARVQLGIATDRFDRLTNSLAKSPDLAVAGAAVALREAKTSGLFQVAIDDAIAGRPAAPFVDDLDLGLLADTFTDSFDLVGPSLDLMDGRAAALDAAVAAYADDASQMAWITFLGSLLMMAVLVGLSLVVAASFERPLRRLIAGTRRVGSGDLHLEPLPVSGPIEISSATLAFNDVVENLRMLEGKLDALADTEFDDPRLDVELPGELGQALARSVEVLSSSIQDRAALQARLAHQATHDTLTGIPNRAGGLAALEGALARSRRQRTTLGLAFLDLDGFKAANDTYGHQVGDAVLCEVADRLRKHARSGDSYARLGGDEFIVIAENIGTPADALTFARRIASVVAEPIASGDYLVEIGVSIGIGLAPSGRESLLHLLAHADRAAYRAKRARTGVELYDELLDGAHGDLLAVMDPVTPTAVGSDEVDIRS
ncbi:diguanylate cyclase domain-containing protein [Aquihabitans daechungensis]|uniref:diguanylate cyclase domain-containing protein n=1 Tax=Aquihabitans daechungensis TaxID=1052257 RepID=UPI003B9F55DA